MITIRLHGIPARLRAGTLIQQEPGDAAGEEPITFVVDEDGFGYADVEEGLARALAERCAEIEILEAPGKS